MGSEYNPTEMGTGAENSMGGYGIRWGMIWEYEWDCVWGCLGLCWLCWGYYWG